MSIRKRGYPHLRLVVTEQRDLCSSNNLIAASPLGTLERACSRSLTEDGARPTIWPISANVSPMLRKSEMRDAHVVMGLSLRDPVDDCQRLPVTAVRNTIQMPRPANLPALDSIGARVRWWRSHRKISRPDFAEKVGMSYSTLSDLENERQSHSRFLHIIAAALRLNPHYLETGKGEPEAEYAQEPPNQNAWPLDIPKSKIDKLNMIERGYLESRMLEALGEIESERRKSRSTG